MPGHRNNKRNRKTGLSADDRLCLCLREVHGDAIYMKEGPLRALQLGLYIVSAAIKFMAP